MPAFVESEIQHILRKWLAKKHDVYAEVSIEAGRIDLVVEKADSEIWGIEVKGTSTTISDIRQVNRYVQDPALDKVFYASNSVEEFKTATDSKGTQFSIDYDEAYRALSGGNQLLANGVSKTQIANAITEVDPRLLTVNIKGHRRFLDCISDLPDFGWPDERYSEIAMHKPTVKKVTSTINNAINWYDSVHKSGVIHVPISIHQTGQFEVQIDEPLSDLLSSDSFYPDVVREAEQTYRATRPTPTSSEIDLQYIVWSHAEGITEAALPNPDPSYSNTINIDFMQFKGADSAPEVLESGGEIVGIEIKTAKGVRNKNRLTDQIQKYIQTGALTRIFVAVPRGSIDAAKKVLENSDEVDIDNIGLIAIDRDGFDTVTSGKHMELEYDSYGYLDYPYHVGYGNATIPAAPDPKSVFTGPK